MSSITTTHRWRAAALAVLTATGLCLALAGPAQAKTRAADPTLTDQYKAVGTSHIGSINADLPISPTKLVETLDLNNFQIIGGTLPIAPQVVSFKALGLVPLRSTVTLTQATPITGSITPTNAGNVLNTTVSYTIKLSQIQVQLLGQWIDLNVGNNCQTINPAVISASSPPGKYFDITRGGVVTGTYTIGKFQNCAPLQLPDLFGLGSIPVNALVPGSNNTVSITLSNGKFVSGT